MATFDTLLTTAQNLVQAVTQLGQTFVNVHGSSNAPGIAAATVIKTGQGRVYTVSVIVAGSAGKIYDATTTSDTTRPLAVIPATAGAFVLDLPYRYGLVVAPGASQIVTVGYT